MRLHHKGFGNDVRIDLVRFHLPDVVLPHRRRLDRVDDADLATSGDEEFDQVVAIMCRRFKTNDEVAVFVRSERGKQPAEAIIVICEFKRPNERFPIS